MTQPPPQPPNEPPQGGYGAPQNPPPGYGSSPGSPQGPGGGYPQQPPAPPGPPSAPPDFSKPPEQQPPGYGAPAAPPPPGQPPQSPPPPGQPPAPGAGQPGYGYPSPGSPQRSSGGYPDPSAAQQPTMAAQPTVAAQPGQYGYPGQQQYGGYQGPTVAQQSVSQGRKFNAQMVIIVAAVVAVALIVGGGVWYAKSGSDDKKDEADSGQTGGSSGTKGGGTAGQGSGGDEKVPANTHAKVLMQLPAPEVKGEAIDSVKGSWLYSKGNIYAKSGVNQVVGYDTETGKQSWQLPLEGQTCAGAPEVTEDGIGAVLYESGKREGEHDVKPCSMVAAIDLKTGTKLWSKKVVANDQEIRFEELSISGNIVAAGGGTDDGAAFDVKTGKSLWAPQTGTCQDHGYAGGEQLVAIRECGDYDNLKYEVQLLGPDGKPKWKYQLPEGVEYPKVLSTKPVVVGVESGSDTTSTSVSDVFSLDDSGKLLTKISIPDDTYDFHCGATDVHDCHGVAVGNGRLYVPTVEHDDSSSEYGDTNEVVSLDLSTGKTTGDRADAGSRYKLFPLRMDGANILAYKDGPYDKGAQVVTIDSKTMKQTTLLETPASRPVLEALSSLTPRMSEIVYGNGRLFIGKELVSKPTLEGDKVYTAIGFAD